MIKRAAPKYKYQNLKDYLIDKIRSGGFDGSGRLDSEPQLCERFSLSRNTIRQAIQELENEGYVYRIHGKGTFIRNATPVNSRKIALMIYDTAYMAHPVTGGLIRGIDETLSRNGYILDILASKRSFHDENLMRLAESYAGFLIGTYQLDELMLAELEKISSHFTNIAERSAAIQKNYLGISRLKNAAKQAANNAKTVQAHS